VSLAIVAYCDVPKIGDIGMHAVAVAVRQFV